MSSVFAQLSSHGAIVPYGICTDSDKNIWVAAKGGLYKLSEDGQTCIFAEKNRNHRQIGAFCNVMCTNDKNGDPKILAKFSDQNSVLTQLVVYDLNGNHENTTLLEGKVQGICTSAEGEVFVSTQPNFRKSEIIRTRISDLSDQDTIQTSTDYGFGQLCFIPGTGNLAVSATALPISPHANQEIQIIDPNTGRSLYRFGEFGKEPGSLYHPRCLQIAGGNLAILDKLGRIQKFSLEKSTNNDDRRFLSEIGRIPANLANGFCFVDADRILVTCSGIVEDEEGRTTCNDWIECLNILSEED